MSKEHKKYLREEENKKDTSQSRFSNDSIIIKPKKEEIKESKLNVDSIVYCPFCLYRNKLVKFIVSDSKNGYSTYKAKCPECKNGMLMKTLKAMHYMTDSKIKSYALWVCNYRQGFWRKVKKDIWDKRLKKYGWAGIFWKKYKEVKASIPRRDNDEEDDYGQVREERLREKEERMKRGEE